MLLLENKKSSGIHQEAPVPERLLQQLESLGWTLLKLRFSGKFFVAEFISSIYRGSLRSGQFPTILEAYQDCLSQAQIQLSCDTRNTHRFQYDESIADIRCTVCNSRGYKPISAVDFNSELQKAKAPVKTVHFLLSLAVILFPIAYFNSRDLSILRSFLLVIETLTVYFAFYALDYLYGKLVSSVPRVKKCASN